jgi:hypothetical protein
VARGEKVSPPVDQAVDQAVDQPVDQPAAAVTTSQVEEADEAPVNDGDRDIKEIIARLEIAAERAQLRADGDSRRDRGEAEPEVLDQAVGGRA